MNDQFAPAYAAHNIEQVNGGCELWLVVHGGARHSIEAA